MYRSLTVLSSKQIPLMYRLRMLKLASSMRISLRQPSLCLLRCLTSHKVLRTLWTFLLWILLWKKSVLSSRATFVTILQCENYQYLLPLLSFAYCSFSRVPMQCDWFRREEYLFRVWLYWTRLELHSVRSEYCKPTRGWKCFLLPPLNLVYPCFFQFSYCSVSIFDPVTDLRSELLGKDFVLMKFPEQAIASLLNISLNETQDWSVMSLVSLTSSVSYSLSYCLGYRHFESWCERD